MKWRSGSKCRVMRDRKTDSKIRKLCGDGLSIVLRTYIWNSKIGAMF